MLLTGFLLGLIFNPQDEGSMFFRNVWISLNYTARRPYSPLTVYGCAERDGEIFCNVASHFPLYIYI
jgi:hypothetical protein